MSAHSGAKIGGEFALIRQFFHQKTQHQAQVDLSVGDDAALFRVAHGQQCVVSTDLLVSGRHFFADAAPRLLGHKALAVNLSDLAAMGAQPLAFTLSIALPSVDEAWLADFSAGMFALAQTHQCDLIGGDTTRSEQLVIGITIFGQLPRGAAILRSGAQVGDDIWVSGTLGGAAYALDLLQNGAAHVPELLRQRLEAPTPRVALGLALRDIATAMLDVSDGLAGDLMHVLRASNLAATIECDDLPMPLELQELPQLEAWRYAVTGGDDYELCFTAPATQRAALTALSVAQGVALTRIGLTTAGAPNITWRSQSNPAHFAQMSDWTGYNHF